MVNSLKENTVLFSFEKLDVYKLARQLVKDVYCLQKSSLMRSALNWVTKFVELLPL